MRQSTSIVSFGMVLAALLAATAVFAGVVDRAPAIDLAAEKKVTEVLRQKYPDARIEIQAKQMDCLAAIKNANQIEVASDAGDGSVLISGRTTEDSAAVQCEVFYSAWVQAWIPTRRILPLELLRSKDFSIQEIDVSRGMARQFRGVILRSSQEVEGLESRQTLLEGQWLSTTAVRKVPDIRRGEVVQVLLRSGSLLLRTSGKAQDESYFGGTLRVLTVDTNKLVTGTLTESRQVEVKL